MSWIPEPSAQSSGKPPDSFRKTSFGRIIIRSRGAIHRARARYRRGSPARPPSETRPRRDRVPAKRGRVYDEFPLKKDHGFADYLLYVDGKAAGVIEAKPEGVTLTDVEFQSTKYSERFRGRHTALAVDNR